MLLFTLHCLKCVTIVLFSRTLFAFYYMHTRMSLRHKYVEYSDNWGPSQTFVHLQQTQSRFPYHINMQNVINMKSRLCFKLAYAAILSTIYSLVMMLVIVGLIKQAAENGFCSVTTVLMCFIAGVFVVSAFIHPTV